ncbi:MlaC/ttg2D family ABC transporter substrate-binding protein [Psychromarinibacter sp. S121]|uniref:MlaC/ttg2D family ABC transporter substrate-binding protein n=1 Tax=Psychromarinibacter sp. S121 TaxID=3415127 RepID=UPI003C7E8AE6
MVQITRRSLVAALAALPFLPGRAFALSTAAAQGLVDQAVADINRAIAGGGSDGQIISQFQNIFNRYADQAYIAAYALGPAARTASAAERSAFSAAFSRYLTAKYGRRFREYQGGTVNVRGAKPVKNWVEVRATADLPGQSPFNVTFYVSDRTGRPLFFNLDVEGVSMLLTEREEIGAMLDRYRGDIGQVTAALQAGG